MVKWPLTATIDQGYDTQKAARVNGRGKRKERGEKEIWNGNHKKMSKKTPSALLLLLNGAKINLSSQLSVLDINRILT